MYVLSSWPHIPYRPIAYKSLQHEQRRCQLGRQTLVILRLRYNFQAMHTHPYLNINYQNHAASTAQVHERQP